MNERFRETTCQATGATDLFEIETIQSLWSGYGKIARYGLSGASRKSLVAKLVRIPTESDHPRGWNTDLSHQRKIKSYQVETQWYKNWNARCDDSCRTPHCLALDSQGNDVLIVLEDLDAAGFSEQRSTASPQDILSCLSWLANFHATFMGKSPDGLWTQGTYWHLDTRPDELKVLDDLPLKRAASSIDQLLEASPFKTLVHGDAKLANFCFSSNSADVAAVDFQYVGGGCGMKDVAYFIGSCLNEEECERQEEQLLNYYFETLAKALATRKKQINTAALEQDWRALYPVAWTDFHRFLKGWSPGHWKLHSYSERLARETLENIR